MFIVLNGPLGIGKSTLAEALAERIEGCAMLSGDSLVSVNPMPQDAVGHLHGAIALLAAHHRDAGYRHFVIEHMWRSSDELADLRGCLETVEPAAEVHVFLLTLPLDANLERIARRQHARAVDEREFELRTVADERALLRPDTGLGEPLDVSAPPDTLVEQLLARLFRSKELQ